MPSAAISSSINCGSLERKLVPMRHGGATILVINTMVRHALNDGAYRERRADCEEAARLLGTETLSQVTTSDVEAARGILPGPLYRRAHHVTSENVRTLAAVEQLWMGNWENLGQLLYSSHESLRGDMNVSCPELDTVVEPARRVGVRGGIYGCRMTGGGFGGCCVALVRAAQASEVSRLLQSEYQELTGITPMIFRAEPSDGAAVLMAQP